MSVIIDKKTIIGPTAAPPALILTWGNILYTRVGDPTNVNEWNTLLVDTGTPFTSVEVDGNNVLLFGGSNIVLNQSALLGSFPEGSDQLLSAHDITNCIIGAGYQCFYNNFYLTSLSLPSLVTAGEGCFSSCVALTSLSLPSLVTAGEGCFSSCVALTSLSLPSLVTAGSTNPASIPCLGGLNSLSTIYLPSLQTAGYACFTNCPNLTTINLPSLVAPNGLGGSPSFNYVFFEANFNDDPMYITIPAAFQTNNSGGNDGDLQYLIDNYTTVNITPV